jgi:PII-like signaling protein
MQTAVRITLYLRESDRTNDILEFLRREQIAGAHVCHAVAGFIGHEAVHSAALIEGGGHLPVVLSFVDRTARVERLLPELLKMAAGRMVVREKVEILGGAPD